MTIKEIILHKNNCEKVNPNQIYNQKEFEKNPFIKIESDNNLDSNNIYCIIMYDIHAPSPIQNTLSPYLHWILMDIQFKEHTAINALNYVEYIPPTPPIGTHTYIVNLYKQDDILQRKKIPKINKRNNFDISSFEKECKLTFITSSKFQATK